MARLNEVWDGQTGAGYITTTEKVDMEQNHVPFYITGVSEGQGRFGKRWVLNIEVNGESRLLSLPANPARDGQLAQVQEALGEFPEVGPVHLQAYPSSFKEPFYAIEEDDE